MKEGNGNATRKAGGNNNDIIGSSSLSSSLNNNLGQSRSSPKSMSDDESELLVLDQRSFHTTYDNVSRKSETSNTDHNIDFTDTGSHNNDFSHATIYNNRNNVNINTRPRPRVMMVPLHQLLRTSDKNSEDNSAMAKNMFQPIIVVDDLPASGEDVVLTDVNSSSSDLHHDSLNLSASISSGQNNVNDSINNEEEEEEDTEEEGRDSLLMTAIPLRKQSSSPSSSSYYKSKRDQPSVRRRITQAMASPAGGSPLFVGRPPRNSTPSSQQQQQQQPRPSPLSTSSKELLLLNEPLTLTTSASSQSYLLQYDSKTKRSNSPWKRIIPNSVASVKRSLSPAKYLNNHSARKLPITIDVSIDSSGSDNSVMSVSDDENDDDKDDNIIIRDIQNYEKGNEDGVESISIPNHHNPSSIIMGDESIFRSPTPTIGNTLKALTATTTTAPQISEILSGDESLAAQNTSIGGYTQSTTFSIFSYFLKENTMSIVYLTAFAIIGTSIRLHMARIFGLDCEFPPEQTDYLSYVSTCVTASGRTHQTGGALFIDLPANMLGSFILGIMTPFHKEIPPLPWLRKSHPSQKHTNIHVSIRTAFCGSLTTFSSWNTQMILMLVGKGTTLGPQIVPALIGYLIGTICSIAAFLSGREFANVLYNFRHPKRKPQIQPMYTSDVEENDSRSVTYSISTMGDTRDTSSSRQSRFPTPLIFFPKIFSFDSRDTNYTDLRDCLCCKVFDVVLHGKYSPLIVSACLVAIFLVGDIVLSIEFHKAMWGICLLSPIGTILRWKLSLLNGKWFQNSVRLKYIPFGTFLANLLACIISATCQAIILKLSPLDDDDAVIFWLKAVKIGFAGCLSTMSTFVKEIVLVSEKHNNTVYAHFYAVGSIVICCAVGLCFYIPIIFS